MPGFSILNSSVDERRFFFFRFASAFIHLGLIDEYRLFLNPIVLGGGIPLFQDIKDWMKLKLLEAKTFQAGVVGLHYQAVRQ